MRKSGLQMVDDYLIFSRDNRTNAYSLESERAIRIGLNQFFGWWGTRSIGEFDRQALTEYKDFLWAYKFRKGNQEKRYSVATVNQRLIVLRKFCEVCRDDWGLAVSAHPIAETVEVQNIHASMLEVEHVRAMVKAVKKHEPQDYAIIAGLFYTGARISELIQVNIEDVGRPEVLVKGKGRKYRMLFMPSTLGRLWRSYAKENHMGSQGPLFTLNNGNRMTRGVAYWRVRRAGKAAQIEDRRIHPHAFRHLYARVLQDGNVPYAIIKQILGHRLDVTETYLQFSRERLFEIIERIKL